MDAGSRSKARCNWSNYTISIAGKLRYNSLLMHLKICDKKIRKKSFIFFLSTYWVGSERYTRVTESSRRLKTLNFTFSRRFFLTFCFFRRFFLFLFFSLFFNFVKFSHDFVNFPKFFTTFFQFCWIFLCFRRFFQIVYNFFLIFPIFSYSLPFSHKIIN